MQESEAEDPALARAGGVLEIDLGAVAENWRRLQARVGAGVMCAAVVKADAYGLGMAQVAPALARAGCAMMFVASLDEGLALRRLLPDVEIAVLNGLLPGTAGEMRAARLIPVLNDLGQIEAWRAATAGGGGGGDPAMIHLDTGMSRLGLSPAETRRLGAEPERLRGVAVRAVLSHLACADDRAHPLNEKQRGAFVEALASLRPTA